MAKKIKSNDIKQSIGWSTNFNFSKDDKATTFPKTPDTKSRINKFFKKRENKMVLRAREHKIVHNARVIYN
jgi:hypothetical protein